MILYNSLLRGRSLYVILRFYNYEQAHDFVKIIKLYRETCPCLRTLTYKAYLILKSTSHLTFYYNLIIVRKNLGQITSASSFTCTGCAEGR
jgi:histone deacetylase complex regulatory component SIN3